MSAILVYNLLLCVFHLFSQQLAPILTQIYRHSLDIGAVLQDWRDAWVVPIFKKGERHIAANYRPVSLTSIARKIMAHIIHSSIMKHFDATTFYQTCNMVLDTSDLVNHNSSSPYRK
jgi:hypothetical protein